MAVNLIDSQDITITQTDNDIQLNIQKDSSVSTSSTKPVENQAITNYVDDQVQDAKDYTDEKSQEVYSTTEIKIGTWINGKPLYRKSYNFGQVDGTSYTINNAFTNVAEVISISGSYKTGLYDRVPISVYYSDTYNCATTLKINTNTIGIGWAGWPRLLGGNIIIEYTKTTD